MIGVLGELATEAELTARLRDLEQVEVAQPELEAGLQAVAAADQRQRVGELQFLGAGVSGDELGVAGEKTVMPVTAGSFATPGTVSSGGGGLWPPGVIPSEPLTRLKPSRNSFTVPEEKMWVWPSAPPQTLEADVPVPYSPPFARPGSGGSTMDLPFVSDNRRKTRSDLENS